MPSGCVPLSGCQQDLGDGSQSVSNAVGRAADGPPASATQSPLRERPTFVAQLKTRLLSGLRRNERADFPSRLLPGRPGTLRFRKLSTARPQVTRVGTRLARERVGISSKWRSGDSSDSRSSAGTQTSREAYSASGSSLSNQRVPSTVGKGAAAAASGRGQSSTSSSRSQSLSPGGQEDVSGGGRATVHRKRLEQQVQPDVVTEGSVLLQCSCSPTTLSCDISMPVFVLSPALLRFLTSLSKLVESPAPTSARLRFYEQGSERGGDRSQSFISRRNGCLDRYSARRAGEQKGNFPAGATVGKCLLLPLYVPLAIPDLPPPSSSASLTACLAAADEAADMARREAAAKASTPAAAGPSAAKDKASSGSNKQCPDTANQAVSAFSFVLTPTSSPSSSFSTAYRTVLDDILERSERCHSDRTENSDCGKVSSETVATFPSARGTGTKGGTGDLGHGIDCDTCPAEAVETVLPQPSSGREGRRFSVEYLRSLATAAATTAIATVSEATSRATAVFLRAEAAVRAKQAQLRNSGHGSQGEAFLALEHLCLQHRHWVADHSLVEQRTVQIEVAHLLVLLPTAAPGMPKALRRARYRREAVSELTGTFPGQPPLGPYLHGTVAGQRNDLSCEPQAETTSNLEGCFSWATVQKVAASPFFHQLLQPPSRAPCAVVSCRTITAAMTPSSSASPRVSAAAVEGLQIGVFPQLRYLMHLLEPQVAVDGFAGATTEDAGLLARPAHNKHSTMATPGVAETAQATSGESAAADSLLGSSDPKKTRGQGRAEEGARRGRRTPLLSEELENLGDPENLAKKTEGTGACYLLLSCPGVAAELLERPPNTALARADGINK